MIKTAMAELEKASRENFTKLLLLLRQKAYIFYCIAFASPPSEASQSVRWLAF